MIPPPRVLFLALDAASPHLVLRWAKEGLLPVFRGLLETASWGSTTTAPGLYTGSLWPSVWTGVTPGRHGCYYNEQLRPGTYEVGEFLGPDIRREPFWNALSRAGRRVAAFDVPKTPLCERINGIHIVDWGTHDSEVLPCSAPSGLMSEILERYGDSGFRRCDWVMRGASPERDLRDLLLKRVEKKIAIAEDLLAREPWDLFMTVFGESHCAGHQCWHVHDETHPRYDARLAAELGDPIRDVYVALDAALGRLLNHAGPETTAIVLLSHGMSAHYDATYLMDDILRRLEKRPASIRRMALDRARQLWKKLPLGFTELFRGLAQTVDRMPDVADRSKRRAFAVPTNANCAGIRLNLVGREPEGLIHPGRECDEFCDQLIAGLNELVEPASGRRLVREVLRAQELFPGEHAALLPDLLVQWNRNEPITGAASPRIGRIVREDKTSSRTGDHRPGGLFFLRGPGIAPGGPRQAARDEDFAPTMAALLGVDLEDVDGAPLIERRIPC